MSSSLFFPRVKQTITVAGSAGVFDLSAYNVPPGFQSIANAADYTYNAPDAYYNICYALDDGTDFEVGVGTYNRSNGQFTRSAILTSSWGTDPVEWATASQTFAVVDFNGALITTSQDALAVAGFNRPPPPGSYAISIGTQYMDGNDSLHLVSSTGSGSVGIAGAATGATSVAIAGAVASSGYSIAIGTDAQTAAGFNYGIALGNQCVVDNSEGIAIGHASESSAANSIAIGQNALAAYSKAVALGRAAVGFVPGALSFGPANENIVGTNGSGFVIAPVQLKKTSGTGTSEVLGIAGDGSSLHLDDTGSNPNALAVIHGKIVGYNGTDFAVYDVAVAIARTSGAVTLLGTPDITATASSAGASGWTVSVAVNGTSVEFSVDAAASTWAGTLTMTWGDM